MKKDCFNCKFSSLSVYDKPCCYCRGDSHHVLEDDVLSKLTSLTKDISDIQEKINEIIDVLNKEEE